MTISTAGEGNKDSTVDVRHSSVAVGSIRHHARWESVVSGVEHEAKSQSQKSSKRRMMLPADVDLPTDRVIDSEDIRIFSMENLNKGLGIDTECRTTNFQPIENK